MKTLLNCNEPSKLFSANYPKIQELARRAVRKYNRVPGMDNDDVAQEALMAAWQAVHDYNPDRHNANLPAFISRYVNNKMAMMLAHALAWKRVPHIKDDKKLARVAAIDVVEFEEVIPAEQAAESHQWHELVERLISEDVVLSELFAAGTGHDEKVLLRLLMTKPPELTTLMRNVQADTVDADVISAFTGWTKRRAHLSICRLRNRARLIARGQD